MSHERQRPIFESEASKQPELLEKAGEGQREKLQENIERSAELSKAENLEEARHEALEVARDLERKQKQREVEQEAARRERAPKPPTKADKEASYQQTMKQIRSDMSAPSRTFSKVIHNPVVEKTSDAVGNTIARPNLIIAGALGTLILTSIIYVVARYYGYRLSGFEAIGTFILGWVIGAIIEYGRVAFANSRRP